MFAKLKRLPRGAAARTVDGLWSALGSCLKQFSPDQCRRHMRHAGYGQTV